ncbi:MAG TPA: transglutaminase-like domain-containing protein [Rhodocyclaceae bacterium]|nr:transglutaminase-like domain-containing protein [Rhodocyclaceae bacterium]
MKRRKFLAATAGLLSLFGPEAWAAKKKQASAHGGSHGSSRKGGRKSSRHGATTPKPSGPVAHTADEPVTDKPPIGSSASRLPPVKAPEPPSEWRTYEITTTVSLPRGTGRARLWLPLPLNQDTLFQRTLGHTWNDNADTAGMRRLPDGNLEVYQCEWLGNTEAKLELTTTVTTADRHFDVTKRTVAPERDDILRRNLQASRLIPNEGLAHQMGERIVGRIKDPVAQGKAIYDWVVENTIYDPGLPGCGNGDVRRQLDSGQYGGRSADINGLFVSICRAIGIPARCVYGLRVGPSRLLRSLGLTSADATRGQHVRAEFYVPGYGWIPVDPADVRRAIALEGLSERDSKLAALRKVLFGVWEMNWIAYNVGTDVSLPGSDSTVPFLLLPQLETSTGRRDGTDAAAFQYAIRTRQLDI